MPVRADWHEAVAPGSVALSGVDPFDPLRPSSFRSMEMTLDTPSSFLHDRLGQLVRRESHLFNEGVTCGIKDSSETACSACPLSRAGDGSSKALLCAAGIEQEQVLTLLAAQRER